MPHADLNAARAARAAAKGEPLSVTLGERDFTLVSELPLEFPDQLAAGRFRLAVGMLLFDATELDDFLALRPTLDDLAEISKLYGFNGVGESSASANSSNGTSRPSRPTSKRSTSSTSPKPAGARKP